MSISIYIVQREREAHMMRKILFIQWLFTKIVIIRKWNEKNRLYEVVKFSNFHLDFV